MNDYVRELADVEAKVRSVENAPWEDALQTLQQCSRRLATLVSLEPNSRATDLLIQISRQYYMRGYTRNADCLGLAALTVQAATRTGDLAKLRQALSIQGLFLGECGCFLDALRVLSRALDAATQLSDPRGVGAAWLNIGVAMSKARLMRETIACAMRALATVDDMADARERANMTMLAQHNISDSYIHLQQFEKALAWSKRAIAIVADEPTITTKNWGVPAHSNAARALVSLGRLVEAQAHVTAAVELSKRSGLERFRSDASAVNGLLLVARGNRDAGLCEIEEAVLEAQGLQEQHMNVLRDKAQALEIAGETERALEVHKAIIVMTRQLQMEAMQFVTTALGEPHAGVLEDASPGSTSSHTALFDLARRSRKLLDGASAAPRPHLTRGYLAKRIKAGVVTGFSAGRSQSRS